MRVESGYRRVPLPSCASVCLTAPPIRTCRQADRQTSSGTFQVPLFSLVQWPTALVPGIGRASASNDQGAMVETDWCVWDRPLPPTDIADANKVQQDSHRRRGKCTFCTNKKPRGRQPDPTEPNRTDKATSPARVRDSPQCLRDTPTPVPADRYGSKTQTSLTMTCPPPAAPSPPISLGDPGKGRRGYSSPYVHVSFHGRYLRAWDGAHGLVGSGGGGGTCRDAKEGALGSRTRRGVTSPDSARVPRSVFRFFVDGLSWERTDPIIYTY